MDKALLNFLALICFVGAIVYVLPMNDIDVGATISHLTMQSISLLPSGLQSFGQITTPRPVPTIINISPWPPGSTPTPTVLPSPTPSTVPSASPPPTPTVTPVPCPRPSPSAIPTGTPMPTGTGPVVVPATTVTIAPSSTVTVTITPVPANATAGPATGNITPVPSAVAGNVTERATSPGNLALVLVVILGLLLVAFIVWNRLREKK